MPRETAAIFPSNSTRAGAAEEGGGSDARARTVRERRGRGRRGLQRGSGGTGRWLAGLACGLREREGRWWAGRGKELGRGGLVGLGRLGLLSWAGGFGFTWSLGLGLFHSFLISISYSFLTPTLKTQTKLNSNKFGFNNLMHSSKLKDPA